MIRSARARPRPVASWSSVHGVRPSLSTVSRAVLHGWWRRLILFVSGPLFAAVSVGLEASVVVDSEVPPLVAEFSDLLGEILHQSCCRGAAVLLALVVGLPARHRLRAGLAACARPIIVRVDEVGRAEVVDYDSDPATSAAPACAGKPCTMVAWSMPAGVHPRACGADLAVLRASGDRRGVSPGARGTCRSASRESKRRWSIPTRAGHLVVQGLPTMMQSVDPRVRGAA